MEKSVGNTENPVKTPGKKPKKDYLLPHWVKYIAWFVCLSVIATSSVVLILYGMKFGLIKSYLWLTAVGSSFVMSILVTQPIKIIITTCVKKFILKKSQKLLWKRIPRKALKNPYNEAKYLQIMEYRKKHIDAYQPTPLYTLKDRFEDIKYTIELRTLAIEVALYVLFMIALYYVVLIDKSTMSYYSSEVIENLVVRAKYSNTLPLHKIVIYEELFDYLNYTLLPTLLVNSTEWHHKIFYAGQNLKNFRKRILQNRFKRDINRNFTKDEKRKIIASALRSFDLATEEEDKTRDENEYGGKEGKRRKRNEDSKKNGAKEKKSATNVYDRGWTLEKSVKLIGKIRLRQIRVRNDSCDFVKQVPTRENECPAELSYWNEERGSFSIMWTLGDKYKFTENQLAPWIYQTGWQSRSVGIYAKFSNYPGGGYVAEFAKSLNNSRLILEFLRDLQWIDFKTRAIFIEFTTYSVDTNLFNVVTLIIERSAVGYFIPSFQIHTTKFMFLENETEMLTIFMFALFTAFLLIFLLRESLRMQKTSLKIYLFRGYALLDFLIIALGFLSVLLTILRSYYVSHLFQTIKESANNVFVSFIYAATWDSITNYIDAILVCLSTVKLFQILTFKVIFYQMETVLKISRKDIFSLALQMLVLIVGFSVFFHLTLIFYDYNFSNFSHSLSTMINRAISMDDTFDFNVFTRTPWYLAPLFFAVFVFFTSVLLFNIFISIVMHNLHRVKLIPLADKYSVFKYLKYRLSSSHKNDVLRLRGGGNSCCRRKKVKKKENLKDEGDEEITQEDVEDEKKEIIRVKLLNRFEQYGRPRVIRFEGMKILARTVLISNEEIKKLEKERLMLAIILQETYRRSYRPYDEKFFFGYVRNQKKLISSFTLLEMKDLAEEILQKKLETKSRKIKYSKPQKLPNKKEPNNLCLLNRKLLFLISKEENLLQEDF